jgi:hypothetical protein
MPHPLPPANPATQVFCSRSDDPVRPRRDRKTTDGMGRQADSAVAIFVAVPGSVYIKLNCPAIDSYPDEDLEPGCGVATA